MSEGQCPISGSRPSWSVLLSQAGPPAAKNGPRKVPQKEFGRERVLMHVAGLPRGAGCRPFVLRPLAPFPPADLPPSDLSHALLVALLDVQCTANAVTGNDASQAVTHCRASRARPPAYAPPEIVCPLQQRSFSASDPDLRLPHPFPSI